MSSNPPPVSGHPDPALARLILQSADEYAIITFSMEGKITSWNAGARRLFGFEADEAVGKDSSLIFTSEDRNSGVPEQELRMALEVGRAANERWHTRKDGSRFWSDGVMLPLQSSLGKTSGFVKIMKDASDKHALRSALQQKEEEIARLQHQVEAAEHRT